MSFSKVLLGVSVILGIGNQSQAIQTPHGAQPPHGGQSQAGQSSSDTPHSHGASSKAGSQSSAQLTPLAHTLLEQIKEKLKHVAFVSCEKPEGDSVKVDLKKLAHDIQNQQAKLQKSQKNYIIRYDGTEKYKCPTSVFTK